MRGAVMYAPGDVRVEERDEPQIVEPTDAIIRVSAACVCGSDLWPYRGIEDLEWPAPMGHEYAGVVEEVGAAVETIRPGQFVVGSFWASDNTCETCRAGYQSACVDRVPMGALGAQAEVLRVPLADGTLVATPDLPADDLIPSLLSASDVLGTGWFGAVAAEAGPGKTVAVVGDGAVGLLAVLAASQFGAERIIAMSRHEPRQRLAREYGATDVVEERGDDGVARIKELTNGLGAHSVVEAVGTQESMMQAIHATRPGGHVGFVGVGHGVTLPGMELFWSLAHLHGGPAPVRRFLPELIDLIWNRQTPARSSTSSCRSRRPPRATTRWINGARSRCSCARNRGRRRNRAGGGPGRRSSWNGSATPASSSSRRSRTRPDECTLGTAPARRRDLSHLFLPSRSSANALLARRARASCLVIRLAWRPVQGHGHGHV
jgi:threonine dehydrogenase-like Zn-dependent dehydrogenase